MKPPDLRDQLRYAYDPQFRGFHNLMARRVRTILMVSNPYESFSMSRDYSLTQDIYGASQLLHLQNVPQIVTALSGEEGLSILGKEHFDLVLVSSNLPDMDTADFGRRVKAVHPSLPVVMIVFDGSWFDETYRGSEPEGIDRTFAWRGSADVLLSIMKLVEDGQNIERDLALASIGTILVIEDAVEHYSLILPHLYSMLMQRTFMLVPEGINESDRQVRTRVRPKVLLARNFGEAAALFDKYTASLLGIISDLHTFHDERVDPGAGVRFLRDVAAREPGIPILVQSSEPDAAELARSVGARYLGKRGSDPRAGIERFVLEDIGFGDFEFRMPDGAQVGRVANMWEMERALAGVPEESFVFHVRRNDFSHWFRARGETTLAAVLRPISIADFPSVDALRSYLIDAISIARRERYRGAIADFRPPEFDPDYPFLVVGRGSLGGKGRDLAFMFRQLSHWLKDDRIEGVKTRLPRTLIVGADESDAFLRENGIEVDSLDGLADDEILRRFAGCRLGDRLRECLQHYVERVSVPLAVRSSGLLEDSHRQPLAGLYATYMLPNNHPDLEVRLNQLVTAVKLVYASAYVERPRRYFEVIGQDLVEVRMAVIIQEVVGRRHGRHFYPSFSGVAQSHNYYPVFQMRPEDGVAIIALGLGKQVVEGGDAVRFSPRYPQVLPQFRSPAEVLKVSQRELFALDLERVEADLLGGTDATLARLPLSQAESDGTLALTGSVVDMVEDRIYDGVGRGGSRVVTFARILKHNAFPLCAILNQLLEDCRRDLGFAVEIEFAVNLETGPAEEPEFHLLQMRPFVALRERCDIAAEHVPPDRLLCRSERVLGNGRIEGLRDVLYVDCAAFDRGRSAEVASIVAGFNERMNRERRHYALLGPGRWGSFDPWIGVPVAWHQISRARVIVEVPARDLPLEPSQGTHFFHNLTSAGIGYFSLAGVSEKEFVRWDLLDALPGEEVAPGVRHVRLDRPLSVRMDGQTQQGIILL
ncbi:MAG TPA: PEP/pyruvate-binding domain-containing protein [Bryobacteraceae bacterium]|nr:PEP/pyruvate-binding domain-containing protein [Bryobacteraceae bacterium]